MKTNKELGAVYLEAKCLDKERFKELTKGMYFYGECPDREIRYGFIENVFNESKGYKWMGLHTSFTISDNAKLITLNELEQLLKTETTMIPTHFAISPEEYEEWQEFKNRKPEIDYSRLKTGSVVRLKWTNQFCSTFNGKVDYDLEFKIVFYKTDHFIGSIGFALKGGEDSYITFSQGDKFVLFSSEKDQDYITEVISY